MPYVNVRDAIRMIEAAGWYLARQYKHATRTGLVTVPGSPGDELAPGTLNSIKKQAGLK